MTRKVSPTQAGELILNRALNRQCDGEFDRITSIMLSLLVEPSTRSVGSAMIGAVFNPHRKQYLNIKTLPYPHCTLATVAEMQLGAEHAELLWKAIPTHEQLGVMRQLACYAVMNNNAQWMTAAQHAITSRVKRKTKWFSIEHVGWACATVLQDIRPIYGEALPEEEHAKSLWLAFIPWALNLALKARLEDSDDMLDVLEWGAGLIDQDSINMELECAKRFLHLDCAQYPALAQRACLARREHLSSLIIRPMRPAPPADM